MSSSSSSGTTSNESMENMDELEQLQQARKTKAYLANGRCALAHFLARYKHHANKYHIFRKEGNEWVLKPEAWIDLVKAFDTVPRESLIRVLAKFGVPSTMEWAYVRMRPF